MATGPARRPALHLLRPQQDSRQRRHVPRLPRRPGEEANSEEFRQRCVCGTRSLVVRGKRQPGHTAVRCGNRFCDWSADRAWRPNLRNDGAFISATFGRRRRHARLLEWPERRPRISPGTIALDRVLQRLRDREPYDAVALSPDGTAVLVMRRTETATNELWKIDTKTGAASQLSITGFSIWGPDSRRLINGLQNFESGTPQLRETTASGVGNDVISTEQTRSWALMPEDWSRDGRWVFFDVTEKTGWDVWALDRNTRKSAPVLNSAANEVQPRLSPDGHWLAYASDESGAWKVYVRPFPSGSGKWTISPDGGSQPVWRHDGKELYFITSDGDLAVSGIADSSFDARPPIRLFRTQLAPMVAPFRQTYVWLPMAGSCSTSFPAERTPRPSPSCGIGTRTVHDRLAESSTECWRLSFPPRRRVSILQHGHGPTISST